MNEKMFYLDPKVIVVKEELPRIRKDMGKVKELLESILKFGQIQPIVINRNNELIAGGRRLAACLLGNVDSLVCYNDTIDPLLMRELELEENLQRKSLTPAEECLAIDEIHKLKQKVHGVARTGPNSEGWTLDNTADMIGKTRGNVIEALQIAEALKEFPALKELKTKQDIKRAVKGMEKVATRLASLHQYEEDIKTKGHDNLFQAFQKDAKELLTEMEDNSIDLILTDPPWGINIHDITIGLGGHTGADITTTGIKYDDSPEEALSLYKLLAKEGYRITKPNAHAYIFASSTHFWTIKNYFNNEGWICSERPVIWIKNSSGQNNNPKAWFSAAYEMILFARKSESRLVVEGKVDWMQFPNLTPNERIHQAEKPVPLLKELISRVSLPGHKMLDPFCGSGASAIAALDLKLIPIVSDNQIECYSAIIKRINDYLKSKEI